MATDFTPDQKSAITYRQQDACVVAGPGSGKTTVLVKRYADLVDAHGFDMRELLAVTFTDKAAANMREKLRDLFAGNDARLRELETSAWVSTIHGLCTRLLKENAIAAGLDPRFTVLDDRESESMQARCLHLALDELTAQRREETLELVEALASPRLNEDLLKAFDAMRAAGISVGQLRAVPCPGRSASLNEIVAELRAIVMSWPAKLTDTGQTEHGRLLQWCADFDAAGDIDLAGVVRFTKLLKINLGRVPRDCKGQLREWRDGEYGQKLLICVAVDRFAARFRNIIFDVLTRFDEEYNKRKHETGKVDFNDLERFAIELLELNPEIKSRMQRQFRQIMLDEYQDINEQQSALIDHLRSEGVFFGVGDRNQSIYGFRHARPEIFSHYRDQVAAAGAHSVNLAENFRSRDAILQFVRDIMKDKDGVEDRPLIAAANFPSKTEPSVEVIKVLEDADEDAIGGDSGENADSEPESKPRGHGFREALWIAHRIQEMRGVTQLGKPGETRPAEYRDFAVLCRTGSAMQPVLAAFDDAGIPYVCGRRESFLTSREGKDIKALLSVIANPLDTISLGCLLRSPLVAISDEGLLRLRTIAGNLSSGLSRFAHAAREDSAAFGIPESDASRLRLFLGNLKRWRQDHSLVPLDTLLSRALTDCGVAWAPSSDSNPDLASANIESFLHLARTTGASMTLSDFVVELNSLASAANTESKLSDRDQGDRVQVMTAHAAKGLEFPVTVIAAMHRGPQRGAPSVSFTREHGLGVKWRNPEPESNDNSLKDSWAEKNSAILSDRETHEQHRLLYVAMTRAEQHLILTYSRGKRAPSNWAALLEGHFNLKSALSPELRIEARDNYEVSIRVTNDDPPRSYQTRSTGVVQDAEILPRPSADGQHDTAVSVTSLAVFASCPRKYYIQRGLGWSGSRLRSFDPDSPEAADDDSLESDLSAADIGTAVHSLLAGLRPDVDAPEAEQLVEVFRQSKLGRRVSAAARVEREWAFIAQVEGTIVRGSIDLWFEEAGELYLVDYKTDAVSAISAPARARDYIPQLALYAVALESGTGKRPKSAWLHFLRPDVAIEVALDDATIHSARELIGGLRAAQEALRFPLREGAHCNECSYFKSLCPAGRAATGGHYEP